MVFINGNQSRFGSSVLPFREITATKLPACWLCCGIIGGQSWNISRLQWFSLKHQNWWFQLIAIQNLNFDPHPHIHSHQENPNNSNIFHFRHTLWPKSCLKICDVSVDRGFSAIFMADFNSACIMLTFLYSYITLCVVWNMFYFSIIYIYIYIYIGNNNPN